MERPGRLERTLEERGRDLLLERGAYPIKMGQDGIPDRLVLWGRCLHFWVEFKKDKKAKLQPGQPLWRKMLLTAGDAHYYVDTYRELVLITDCWELLYGPATARQLLRTRPPDGGGPALLPAAVHRLHRP